MGTKRRFPSYALIQVHGNVESPMKMTATIELEFESAGETTHNAMDAALIRGPEALKKGIELTETGTPRRSIKSGSTKWNIVNRALS